MIVDAHHLFGTDHWLKHNRPALAHENTAEHAGEAMAACSAEWFACVFPFPSSEDGTYAAENRLVLRAASRDPRLLPVLALNPAHPDSRSDVAALLKLHPYVAGIVLWPILCRLDLVDLAGDTWFADLVLGHGLTVTVHVAAGNEVAIGRVSSMERYLPMDAITLAQALPGVRFNLSHGLRLSEPALEAARELTNVWTDTSGLSAIDRWQESGQAVFPATDAGRLGTLSAREALACLAEEYTLGDRLLFGSSYPFNAWWDFDVSKEVRLVEEALSDPHQRKRVLAENARAYVPSTCTLHLGAPK